MILLPVAFQPEEGQSRGWQGHGDGKVLAPWKLHGSRGTVVQVFRRVDEAA